MWIIMNHEWQLWGQHMMHNFLQKYVYSVAVDESAPIRSPLRHILTLVQPVPLHLSPVAVCALHKPHTYIVHWMMKFSDKIIVKPSIIY